MVKVKRRTKESSYSLLRRFTDKLKDSGLLREIRKSQFYKRPKNKRRRREEAMVKAKYRKERKRLMKLGLLEEGEKMKKKPKT